MYIDPEYASSMVQKNQINEKDENCLNVSVKLSKTQINTKKKNCC